ncbi:hypothetical protein GF324_01665 [bacterium]|nr:hypothetical protein [bacterium]
MKPNCEICNLIVLIVSTLIVFLTVMVVVCRDCVKRLLGKPEPEANKKEDQVQ